MLLTKIKNDSNFASYNATVNGQVSIKKIIDTTCCENNVCVDIDDGLSRDDYVIIKVDAYFQKSKSGNTRKGVDCLIVVKGRSEKYCLYLIELKDEESNGLSRKIDTIIGKFQDTIDCVLKEKKFKEYFNRFFESIDFVLVSKVYHDSEKNKQRDKLLKSKAFSNLLNRIYKVPLEGYRGTELIVSIKMKHRDTKKLIKACN